MGQKVCSIRCSVLVPAKKKKAAIERRHNKKSPKDLAQDAFNAYIRARDRKKPCVSCGKPPGGHQRHASHYKSRGSRSDIRYNVFNVHASCSQCNNHLSGNIGPYKEELIRRIGIDRVERLEVNGGTRKYSDEYCKRLQAIFKRRAAHYLRNE